MSTNIHDYDFELPSELIAQTPLADRDRSRLMVLNKVTGQISHKHFSDIANLLKPGDALILNDSRVLPARLMGQRRDTGGKVEVLLLTQRGPDIWEVLVKPGRRVQPGVHLVFGQGLLTCEVCDVTPQGGRLVRFHCEGDFDKVIDCLGKMPLPPYIKADIDDPERYQTIYSRVRGSSAAPTAGLHFTKALLHRLEAQGVAIAYLTLHVGLGTFRPVQVENILEHHMHSEYFELSEGTAALINKTHQNGGRVVAVGTTVTRTLESIALSHGKVVPCSGWTDIFIYPGFQYNIVDALLTNFHLPMSTLIMLVSALAGRENILRAYDVAIAHKYRFFSFGDAMFIA